MADPEIKNPTRKPRMEGVTSGNRPRASTSPAMTHTPAAKGNSGLIRSEIAKTFDLKLLSEASFLIMNVPRKGRPFSMNEVNNKYSVSDGHRTPFSSLFLVISIVKIPRSFGPGCRRYHHVRHVRPDNRCQPEDLSEPRLFPG